MGGFWDRWLVPISLAGQDIRVFIVATRVRVPDGELFLFWFICQKSRATKKKQKQ